MYKAITLIIITFFFSACSPQTIQSQLNKTMSEMIVLIDQGKNKELVEKYADLSGFKGRIPSVSEKKMKVLKFHMLQAKKLSPTISENGNLAIYNDPSFKRPLKFIKSKNRWLLKDK
jgi:hypothetical protein